MSKRRDAEEKSVDHYIVSSSTPR